jgi:hypothetical protein
LVLYVALIKLLTGRLKVLGVNGVHIDVAEHNSTKHSCPIVYLQHSRSDKMHVGATYPELPPPPPAYFLIEG